MGVKSFLGKAEKLWFEESREAHESSNEWRGRGKRCSQRKMWRESSTLKAHLKKSRVTTQQQASAGVHLQRL